MTEEGVDQDQAAEDLPLVQVVVVTADQVLPAVIAGATIATVHPTATAMTVLKNGMMMISTTNPDVKGFNPIS